MVADPAGTLTPCSQSPLYIFPGSCRVAVPSITWSYLTPSRSSRLTSSLVRPRPAARVSRSVPEESSNFLPPRDPPTYFSPRLFRWLSYFPFYLLRRSPLLGGVPRRADFAHSFFLVRMYFYYF